MFSRSSLTWQAQQTQGKENAKPTKREATPCAQMVQHLGGVTACPSCFQCVSIRDSSCLSAPMSHSSTADCAPTHRTRPAKRKWTRKADTDSRHSDPCAMQILGTLRESQLLFTPKAAESRAYSRARTWRSAAHLPIAKIAANSASSGQARRRCIAAGSRCCCRQSRRWQVSHMRRHSGDHIRRDKFAMKHSLSLNIGPRFDGNIMKFVRLRSGLAHQVGRPCQGGPLRTTAPCPHLRGAARWRPCRSHPWPARSSRSGAAHIPRRA